ncbi:MAG: PAS domain S-box protein, partial [Acidobacteria bacterium]|nr:PAS domain S-box protein [Acidobacteriota bacterium]
AGLKPAIRDSEERYLSLFNRSLDCIYVHDFAGNFLDANNSFKDFRKTSSSAIINMLMPDFSIILSLQRNI